MVNNDKLSIILPIYNPHENWEIRLSNSLKNLSKLFSKVNFEIILINDGSTIKIKDKIEDFLTDYSNLKYFEYPENKGKGHAIKFGVENSDSDYYIYSDFDFPFGYHAIFETYNLLINNNCDLVFGKRDKAYFNNLPIKRHIISKCLRTANYIMLGFKTIDTQAGLKGFKKRIKNLLLSTKTDRFIFEFEFMRKCVKNDCAIIPLNLSIDENISFSDFRFSVIFRELKIYFKLILKDE